MAQPVHHLLTLEEFDALPEDDSARYELQEGVVIVSPRPRLRHQQGMARLLVRLGSTLPRGWEGMTEPDLLVDAGSPATVRIPDLIVTRSVVPDRMLRASEVALAVEIISPGSRKLDRVLKAYEYAQAGIPQYWVVDLEVPEIAVFTLGPEGYTAQDPVSDELRTTLDLDGPVEVVIDVGSL
jgi:Uma2 family endonuclease